MMALLVWGYRNPPNRPMITTHIVNNVDENRNMNGDGNERIRDAAKTNNMKRYITYKHNKTVNIITL